MREISVIVIEPQGKTLQDRRGQFRWFDTPLFAGIASKKSAVHFLADHAEGLLLKICGLRDVMPSLLTQILFGLGRIKRGSEKLIDGEQVDRHRKDAPLHLRHDPVAEWHQFPEFAEEGVDALIVGMKDMRPISMRHHLRLLIAVGVTIAARMRPFVNDKNLVASLRERTRNYGTAEAGSDNAEG
jgi:hypothetical protein